MDRNLNGSYIFREDNINCYITLFHEIQYTQKNAENLHTYLRILKYFKAIKLDLETYLYIYIYE